MTTEDLARSYLIKARARLKALAVLRDEADHSDVVREAQELVELAAGGYPLAGGRPEAYSCTLRTGEGRERRDATVIGHAARAWRYSAESVTTPARASIVTR